MYILPYWKKDNGHNIDMHVNITHILYIHTTQMQVHTLALHTSRTHSCTTRPPTAHATCWHTHQHITALTPPARSPSSLTLVRNFVCMFDTVSLSFLLWLARGKSSLPSSYASAVQSATTIKREVQRHITYIHRQIVAAASCFACVFVMS